MTREREYFFGEDQRRPPGAGGGGMMGGAGGMGGGMGGARPGAFRSHQVKALKETMHSAHRTGLTPKMMENFSPGPPLSAGTELKIRKPRQPISGVAGLVHMFAGPQDPEEIKETSAQPRLFRNPELQLQCRLNTETQIEKRIRLNQWKREEAVKQAAEAAKAWDPHKDPKIDGDPFRTLFVARVSYDVTDKKLRREFEEFGPIKKVTMVTNTKTGKPRGYAFIEYEDKKDMKEAYKTADGRELEGRRVLVDVERGRTVESWKPRRLAGGLGGEGRVAKPPLPKNARKRIILPPPEEIDRRAALTDAARKDAEVNQQRERDRMERDRVDRERDRAERERPRGGGSSRDYPRDRERDRDRGERDTRERDRDRDRDRGGDRDRERDRDRDRDRERKREREASPRREREREDRGGDREDKRRRGGGASGAGGAPGELEDGEVHDAASLPPPPVRA